MFIAWNAIGGLLFLSVILTAAWCLYDLKREQDVEVQQYLTPEQRSQFYNKKTTA